MSRPLPPRPNLDHLKKQAKHLLKAFNASQWDACRRIQTHLPRLEKCSPAELPDTRITLQETQHIIAREYGFNHWAELVASLRKKESEDWPILKAQRGFTLVPASLLNPFYASLVPSPVDLFKARDAGFLSATRDISPFDKQLKFIEIGSLRKEELALSKLYTILYRSNFLAHRMQYDYVGTEHLLLTLIRDGGRADAILASLDMDMVKLGKYIQAHTREMKAVTITGAIHETRLVRQVVGRTVHVAIQGEPEYVDEYLLFELAREEKGLAAKALKHVGIDFEKIKK